MRASSELEGLAAQAVKPSLKASFTEGKLKASFTEGKVALVFADLAIGRLVSMMFKWGHSKGFPCKPAEILSFAALKLIFPECYSQMHILMLFD